MTELAEPQAQPPAKLSAMCAGPVTLPDADLSAGQVERLWGADRAALMSCGARHSALSEFYTQRDKALAGK